MITKLLNSFENPFFVGFMCLVAVLLSLIYLDSFAPAGLFIAVCFLAVLVCSRLEREETNVRLQTRANELEQREPPRVHIQGNRG